MPRLLFLYGFPPLSHDVERFRFEELKNLTKLTIVDCTAALGRDVTNLRDAASTYVDSQVTTLGQFRDLLDATRPHAVVDLLHDPIRAHRFRLELARRNLDRIVLQCGLLPSPPRLASREYISALAKPRLVAHFLRRKAVESRHQGHSGTHVITGGTAATVRGRERCYPSHSFDFERHCRTGASKQGTMVFLDDGMARHPDYEYLGIDAPVTEHTYGVELRAILEHLSVQTALRPVVALHPSVDESPLQRYLPGFDMSIGRTPELVRDADLVITHHSTSVSFAVLSRTPIIFLTSNEIQGSPYGPLIDYTAECLHSKVINMSTAHFGAVPATVNEQAYADYQSRFLVHPNDPGISIAQTIAQIASRVCC